MRRDREMSANSNTFQIIIKGKHKLFVCCFCMRRMTFAICSVANVSVCTYMCVCLWGMGVVTVIFNDDFYSMPVHTLQSPISSGSRQEKYINIAFSVLIVSIDIYS